MSKAYTDPNPKTIGKKKKKYKGKTEFLPHKFKTVASF